MKKIGIYCFLILLLIINSCSPVRGKKTYGGGKKESSAKAVKKDERKPDSGSQYNKGRVSDTTTVVINPSLNETQYSPGSQFDIAVKEFDEGNYNEACQKAAYFAETFAYGDSMYYESLFLLSECAIVNENYDDAEKTLKNLLNEKSLPRAVDEKALVRLGQLYCVKGKDELAQKYFAIFKKKYPKSIYYQLANCSAVREK